MPSQSRSVLEASSRPSPSRSESYDLLRRPPRTMTTAQSSVGSDSRDRDAGPLQSYTKMLPVPDSLLSPDNSEPVPVVGTDFSFISSSGSDSRQLDTKSNAQDVDSEDKTVDSSQNDHDRCLDVESCAHKNAGRPQNCTAQYMTTISTQLKWISNTHAHADSNVPHPTYGRLHVEQQQHPKITPTTAAICIQRFWRGYATRHLNRQVQEMYRTILLQRCVQTIEKLQTDMKLIQDHLQNERKIQMLQTEAIHAIWRQCNAAGGQQQQHHQQNTLRPSTH